MLKVMLPIYTIIYLVKRNVEDFNHLGFVNKVPTVFFTHCLQFGNLVKVNQNKFITKISHLMFLIFIKSMFCRCERRSRFVVVNFFENQFRVIEVLEVRKTNNRRQHSNISVSYRIRIRPSDVYLFEKKKNTDHACARYREINLSHKQFLELKIERIKQTVKFELKELT